ncbi:MAG: STAS domain-containing protein [Planctomycetota bacterium]
MPDLRLDVSDVSGGVTLIKTRGFLDAHTFEQLEDALNKQFEQGRYRIVVDLAELQYISSAGAGVFIGTVGRAQENSGNIVLLNPPPNVKEVFDLLGLTQLFSVVPTREDAVRCFATA